MLIEFWRVYLANRDFNPNQEEKTFSPWSQGGLFFSFA
jgi:hypothetical protein